MREFPFELAKKKMVSKENNVDLRKRLLLWMTQVNHTIDTKGWKERNFFIKGCLSKFLSLLHKRGTVIVLVILRLLLSPNCTALMVLRECCGMFFIYFIYFFL